MAPVTFFVREEALWMDLCLQQRQIPEVLNACLSELAKLRSFLFERGAMFSGDLARRCLCGRRSAARCGSWSRRAW